MLDLILEYFKGVHIFFDNLEEITIAECNAQLVKTADDINTVVRDKINEVDSNNLMIKLFNLKNVNECISETNI